MKLQKQKTDYKRGYSKYVIVIPKDSKTNYSRQFVNEIAHDIGIPRAVPIVPWEDFAEH